MREGERSSAITVGAILTVGAWLLGTPAFAGTTVYKCVKDGQTTLTDKPCPGDESTDASRSQKSTIVPSSHDLSPIGKWSGQLQYQENENGQIVQAAHSVALMSAEFTSDGKLTGASPENGCQMLGLWSQGPQTLIWVDVTFNRCSYGGLNRRYNGSFILARPDSSGYLNISSVGAPLSRDMGRVFDIKGTIHR
jgi:hypothetical protein